MTFTMRSKLILVFIILSASVSMYAQSPAQNVYLEKINRQLPHKFKELKTGATLEAVREKEVVKIFMLVDDIEQYDRILVERGGDDQQNSYSQCKEIEIDKGKFKNNYVEVTDQYPLSTKMSNQYRIKTVTSEGIVRIFPPISIAVTTEASLAR